jgi:hypothetical protein
VTVPQVYTQRSLWQREPVRVIGAVFLLVNGVNALLLGIGAYDGGAAAAVTGFIAVASTAVGELFTRPEVVPIHPLEDLADAERLRGAAPPTSP